MLRTLLVVIMYLLLARAGYSQEPNYRHFQVEDGLPSTEVYHVYQDSRGFIWVATDMGVARYDGNQFQHFDLEDGLPGNTVFEIYEDQRGRIWFITLSLKLGYYIDGEIKSYRYNQALQDVIGNTREVYQKGAFYVDSSGHVYIGIRTRGLYRIDTSGTISRVDQNRSHVIEAFEMENRLLISKATHFTQTYEQLSLHQNNQILDFPISFRRQKAYNRAFAVQNHNTRMLYFDSNLLQVNEDTLYKHQYQPDVIWMSRDNNQRLWLGTRDGAIMYEGFSIDAREEEYLDGYNISSVMQDHEGGVWFSTLHHGVFYAPNLSVINYSTHDGLLASNIDELASDTSGRLWIGYAGARLGRFKNDTFTHYLIDSNQRSGISCLKYDPYLDRIWMGRWSGLYYMDLSGASRHVVKRQGLAFVKDIYIQGDKRWFGASKGLRFYKGKVNAPPSFDHPNFRHQVGAVFYQKDTLYIGTLNGLQIYTNGNYFHLGKKNDLLYHRITDIIKYNDMLVMGTRGAGMLLKKGERVFQITQDDGLISNSIKNLATGNNYIWAVTNQGISRIDFINVEQEDYQVFNLSHHNGMPTPEANDLAVMDSLLYISTTRGLTCFNMNHVHPNRYPPKVYPKNVKINDQDTAVLNDYRLSYDQNFFTVHYKGLSYRSKSHLNYRYRMLGLDSTWKPTQRRVKSYTTLPPGEYVFQVKASNEDGYWSREPLSIAFHIAKPFWKTWWFIGLVVLVVGALAWMIIHYRIQAVKRRRELLQNINEYRQQMLRQQMNPHFIFNTLNSIQYFLLDEDTTSSLTYLSKFAKLMRIVLDNSQHTFIPIEDEIRGLRLYLELESLRFEESFDYDITVDEDVNTFEYKIPALLIQPYVENSIRHGLLHKKGKGYLKVHITRKEDYLFLIIEDNGIGRKKAEEIKMKQGAFQQSLGSKITEDRISILNSLYSDEIDITYLDLEDEKGNARGTRVEIRLPFVF